MKYFSYQFNDLERKAILAALPIVLPFNDFENVNPIQSSIQDSLVESAGIKLIQHDFENISSGELEVIAIAVGVADALFCKDPVLNGFKVDSKLRKEISPYKKTYHKLSSIFDEVFSDD